MRLTASLAGALRPPAAVGLLVAGWTGLALAWAVANPPFAAPDEHDHYIRALGVTEGVWAGERTAFVPASGLESQERWASAMARRVPIPAGLAPPAQCYVLDARTDASCIEKAAVPPDRALVTPVGSYQPVPYALPAALMQAARDPSAAVRLGRAGIALPALALLALALVALRHGARSEGWFVGAALAATPTVFTSIAALNPSGWEVAGGIAFGACLLRALRPGDRPPAWVWWAVGVSGAALALSKTSGFPWLGALLLVGVVAGGGPRAAWARVKEGGRAARVAAAAIAASLAANRAWEMAKGPDMPLSFANPRSALEGGFEQWGRAADELVAAFGYLEVAAPWWVIALWGSLLVLAVAVAMRNAPGAGRLAIALAAAGAVVGPPLLYALVIRHTGFGLQGRHVLPVIAVIALLAGELLARRSEPRRHLVLAVAGGTALAQVAAWWVYARRSAVGIDGPWLFAPDAAWSPPGGYALWIVVVVASAALTVAAAVAATRRAPSGARSEDLVPRAP